MSVRGRPVPAWSSSSRVRPRPPSHVARAVGHRHNLTVLAPPLDFCAIEKVASSQWRTVQCLLNEGQGRADGRPCPLDGARLRDRGTSRAAAQAVFFRDPLERLLSGYLNKCEDAAIRRAQGHCEPKSVFDDAEMMQGLRQDPRQLFAAFVDAFPLTWDVHFFPQSLYCDLVFRHVRDYDFVGIMDGHFFRHLQNMSAVFPHRLPDVLEEVFHASREVAAPGRGRLVGTETNAAARARDYYTAASVRRALEYFAVDYVRLGLAIPDWVHAVLAEEGRPFAG